MPSYAWHRLLHRNSITPERQYFFLPCHKQPTMCLAFKESRDYRVACFMITWCRRSCGWFFINLLPFFRRFHRVFFCFPTSLVWWLHLLWKRSEGYWASRWKNLQSSRRRHHDNFHDPHRNLLPLSDGNHGGLKSFRWLGRRSKKYSHRNNRRYLNYQHGLSVVRNVICRHRR